MTSPSATRTAASSFGEELEVARGESVAVVGPSGCGKTTLLHLLAGILAPASGSVVVDGVESSELGREDRQDFRALAVGLVFQEFELLDYLDVLDNVLLPYRVSPALTLDGAARQRAVELVEQVGLADKKSSFPRQLSQGERQRVAVCRSLVTRPKVLFGDEPTANLDADNRDHVMDTLFRYTEEQAGAAGGRDPRSRASSPLRHRGRRAGAGAMRHVIFMAWRYLGFYWGKTAVLVASISLILFVPAGLHVLVEQGAEVLTARAEATPLLIGAKGSAVDLTLSALYFRPPHVEPMPHREVTRVDGSGLARGIPLHLRFAVGRQRIVGTTLDYAEFRGLTVDRGRWLAMLGECVLGSEAARALGVDVGDHVLSSAGSAFDVAGSFPLKMPVVGVLAPTGTADDEIVLVDLKTAWVIAGLAHGHEDVNSAGDDDRRVLQREGKNVVANASVLSYTEITAENTDSFHFHGDPGTSRSMPCWPCRRASRTRFCCAGGTRKSEATRCRWSCRPRSSTSCSTPCSRCATGWCSAASRWAWRREE